jgi:hypothetical protein
MSVGSHGWTQRVWGNGKGSDEFREICPRWGVVTEGTVKGKGRGVDDGREGKGVWGR